MAKVVVGKASDIPEGKLTHVTAGGKEVLVANVGGSYYAIGDICNHAGADLQAQGRAELQGRPEQRRRRDVRQAQGPR